MCIRGSEREREGVRERKSERFFKFVSMWFGEKRCPPRPTSPPPCPSMLPWLQHSHDCSDKFNPGAGGGVAPSVPDCFSCSVMEMQFPISLHLKYLNTSLLGMRLSGLLAHFPPYKCCVVLQSLDEFQLLCRHPEIRFSTNRGKCELCY